MNEFSNFNNMDMHMRLRELRNNESMQGSFGNDAQFGIQEQYGMQDFGEGGFHEMEIKRKTQRLFKELENKGDFSTLDKAKHNEHYRNFLLENFDGFGEY